jgi:hypothetical protein
MFESLSKTIPVLICTAITIPLSLHAGDAPPVVGTPKKKKEIPAVQKMIRDLPASKVPSDPKKFDVYLLVGQSNMAGRGILTDADQQSDPRVLTFNAKDTWVNQGEPIHFDKAEAGVGLGFTFAKLMADSKSGVVVGLVPCAVGGSKIEQWQPGQLCFDRAVKRTLLALQQGGTLKGILWHQGESSCRDLERVNVYAKELAQIIAAFRQALDAPDVPFLAGELGEFIYEGTGNPFTRKFPFARELNAQINSLSGQVPNFAVVPSVGLTPNEDQLHFSGESQKEFGKRYHETFSKLTEKQ